MSYFDVGKDAKLMGRMHPKNAPEPRERPTPAAKPHEKPEKQFGYSYEVKVWPSNRSERWARRYVWFKTEDGRDKSMRALARKIAEWDWYRDLRAERRNE